MYGTIYIDFLFFGLVNGLFVEYTFFCGANKHGSPSQPVKRDSPGTPFRPLYVIHTEQNYELTRTVLNIFASHTAYLTQN